MSIHAPGIIAGWECTAPDSSGELQAGLQSFVIFLQWFFGIGCLLARIIHSRAAKLRD